MARKGLAAAAAAALALSATGLGAASAAPAPLRMVVLGDSLAVGTGASDPANGFAFRVYRSIARERPGSEVTNRAIGGSRASDVKRLQVATLDPRATDLVLLVAGGNDVVRKTPAGTFARDYDALLAAIRRRVPRAVVVVCGVPDVARSPLFADTAAKTEALARVDDAAVRAAAARDGDAFVDLFASTRRAGTNAEFFSQDDFHPSDAGYAKLASATLPVVERALRRGR